MEACLTTISVRIDPEGSDQGITINDLVIAGWTGRDVGALEEHIRELEQLGVPRPGSVPCFYRVSAANLTTASRIECLGDQSSGEVEFLLVGTEDGMLIGLGSDHTDRNIETMSVPVSKQMCAKPVSPVMWRFESVADHFDQLILRSWVTEEDRVQLYQEGPVSAMRSPADLIGLYLDGASLLPSGMAMYCGTLAAIGGIRPARHFRMELEDPVLDRRIGHAYDIHTLPVVT